MTRDDRSSRWLLFLGALGFFTFFAHGYLENADTQITLQAARAWYLRGDPGLVRAGDEHLLAEGESTWESERYVAERIAPRDPNAQRVYGVTGTNGKQYIQYPIGHQLLMLPFVAAGELLADALPGPEQEFANAGRGLLGHFYWSQFLLSFLSPLAAAGSFMVLLSIARSLGACPREALAIVAVATLCTQFWPESSETMSDSPGMFFLFVCAMGVARYASGPSGWRGLLLAGVGGGSAVLVRYPHAVPVLALCGWAAVAALRRHRGRDLLAMVAGGAPFALFLAVMNHARFGDVFETGYSTGANALWFSYPIYLGLPLVLLAPGKGLMWFSLPLWIAFAQYLRRSFWSAASVVALIVFALPAMVIARTHGWAGGQCWGVRYLTPAAVFLVVVALALGRPWRRRPRLVAAVCGLGLIVSVGGVLAPYRGQQVLAEQGAAVMFADEISSGELARESLPDHVNFEPRLSPIHSHWSYAWLALRGRLDTGRSEDTLEPMFGLRAQGRVAPPPRDDRAFRHWWIVHAGELWGVAAWPLCVAAWWALTIWLLVLGVRRYR